MKIFEEFKRTGDTFAQRTGAPDEFSSALGRIAIHFSELEDKLATAITALLEVSPDVGNIVASELSFKNKVNLMASLTRHYLPATKFNVGKYDVYDTLDELIKICFKAEELRNSVMHSSWQGSYFRDEMVRIKITAKAKKGLLVRSESYDSGLLLDISDYIIYVFASVEVFFHYFDDDLKIIHNGSSTA